MAAENTGTGNGIGCRCVSVEVAEINTDSDRITFFCLLLLIGAVDFNAADVSLEGAVVLEFIVIGRAFLFAGPSNALWFFQKEADENKVTDQGGGYDT